MEIFVSHYSALSYWRAVGQDTPRPNSLRPNLPNDCVPKYETLHSMLPELSEINAISLQPKTKCTESEASRSQSTATPPSKLYILSPAADKRQRHDLVSCRVWSSRIPIRSFAKVSAKVSVSSPEFTFLQLARDLDLISLIQIGFELCGSYSINPNHPKGFHARPQVTSTAKLASYLESAQGAPGTNKAMQAARFVIDNSASPAETKLAMFLTLPTRYGGFGLPKPELNRTVITSTELNHTLGNRICDLVWEQANLAIEYDSDAEHALSHKIHADSVRRNELVTEGITVITVTKRQLYNLIELRKIVEQISPMLTDRYRVRTKDHSSRQHQLYGRLLAS